MAAKDAAVMSTLELQRFESVPAGNGQVLFRLAGRWPQQADAAGSPATLVVRSGSDTHELDALPEPGLSGDGSSRSAAFAGPERLRSDATAFALAVGGLVFELPACDSPASERRTAGLAALPRPRMRAPRLPTLRLPELHLPRPRLAALRTTLPRPRLEAWDADELRVMTAGCALGAACATAILVELVP